MYLTCMVSVRSTTPTGTPPRDYTSAIEPAKPPPDTASILANLQALANLPKPNSSLSVGNPVQGSSTNNVSFPAVTMAQSAPPVNSGYSMPAAGSAVNAPAPINGGVMSYGLPNFASHTPFPQPPAQPPMMPQNGQNMGGADGGLQQQLQILSALKAQGIPEAQWPALLSVLMQSQNSAGGNNAGAAAVGMPPQQQQHMAQAPYGGGNREDPSRDRNGYDQFIRSPPGGRYRDRSRSRSPRRGDRYRDGSPPRRGSPVYGDYGGRDGANRRQDRGRGAPGTRQRSPDRGMRSPPPQDNNIGSYERLLEYDPSIGEGMIKGKCILLHSYLLSLRLDMSKLGASVRLAFSIRVSRLTTQTYSPESHSIRWRSHVSSHPMMVGSCNDCSY